MRLFQREDTHNPFLTAEEISRLAYECGSEIVLEVASGKTPRIYQHAVSSSRPRTMYIAQDINKSAQNHFKKSKSLHGGWFPDCFYYARGAANPLINASTLALTAMYPNNQQETLRWLPQNIEYALTENPDAYVSIVTERIWRNPFALADHLHEFFLSLGVNYQMNTITFDEANAKFGPTEYSNRLRIYTNEVHAFEVNVNRRPW